MSQPLHLGDVDLGSYTFVSHTRDGLGAAAGSGELGATVQVWIPVNEQDAPAPAVTLLGPGEITALDQRQIIRQYPEAGTTDAEPTSYVHCELDQPGLPWMFTPRGVENGTLPPWLALVVLRDGRYELRPGSPLPAVRTFRSELQSLDDSWRWAHVQMAGNTGASLEDRLSDTHALTNLSRLICPRPLDPDTGYLACLVPAYEAGRRAALGQAAERTTAPAWGPQPAEQQIELPVFHTWWFATGPAGDFATLAAKLVWREAPPQLGLRTLDTSRPWGRPEITEGRRQLVWGPLVSPTAPLDSPRWDPAASDALAAALNAADIVARDPAALSEEDLPRIGPPIYGGRHLGRSSVGTADDWLGQLNLLPVNRVVAGLAARVVQRDQEALMQAAWAQVGAIEEANSRLRHAQLARFTAQSLHERHLSVLPYGDLAQVARPVQNQLVVQEEVIVRDDGALPVEATVREVLAGSATAEMLSSAALRRIALRHNAGCLFEVDGVARDCQRPYVDPQFEIRPDLSPLVTDHILASIEVIHTEPDLTDLLTQPDEAWYDPEFDAANWYAEQALVAVTAVLPADPAAEPERATVLLDALAGLHLSGGDAGTAASQLAVDVVSQLGTETADHALVAAAEALPAQVRADVVRAPEAESALVAAVREQEDRLAAAVLAMPEQELTDLLGQALPPNVLAEAAKTELDPTVLVTASIEVLPAEAVAQAVVEVPVWQQRLPVIDDTVEAAPGPGEEVIIPEYERFVPGDEAVAYGDEALQVNAVLIDGVGYDVDVLVDLVPEADLAGIALEHLSPPELVDIGRTTLGMDGLAGLARNFDDDQIAGLARGLEDDLLAGYVSGLPPELLGKLVPQHVEVDEFCGLMLDQLGLLGEQHWISEYHATLAGLTGADVASELATIGERSRDDDPVRTPLRPPFTVAREEFLGQVWPPEEFTAWVTGELGELPAWLPEQWFDDRRVRPVLAAPVFTRPMYQALAEYDRDWLVPGLGEVEQPDVVVALAANPVFIEAFLAGLSHELARELLWRGYPTDQRGTHFRRFFDDQRDELRQGLHEVAGNLGSHVSPGGMLVLLVRGDLVRRYPNLIVTAMRSGGTIAPIVFQRTVAPDILLVGFNLSITTIRDDHRAGRDWWIFLAEHPGAPRFDTGVPIPGGSAAEVAAALLRPATRVAFNAYDLLPGD